MLVTEGTGNHLQRNTTCGRQVLVLTLLMLADHAQLI